jgi:hypothetical protein
LKTIVHTLFCDLGLGDFVLMRLVDTKLYCVDHGKGKNEVVKHEQFDNFKHVHIQWWVRMKKRARNDR